MDEAADGSVPVSGEKRAPGLYWVMWDGEWTIAELWVVSYETVNESWEREVWGIPGVDNGFRFPNEDDDIRMLNLGKIGPRVLGPPAELLPPPGAL